MLFLARIGFCVVFGLRSGYFIVGIRPSFAKPVLGAARRVDLRNVLIRIAETSDASSSKNIQILVIPHNAQALLFSRPSSALSQTEVFVDLVDGKFGPFPGYIDGTGSLGDYLPTAHAAIVWNLRKLESPTLTLRIDNLHRTIAIQSPSPYSGRLSLVGDSQLDLNWGIVPGGTWRHNRPMVCWLNYFGDHPCSLGVYDRLSVQEGSFSSIAGGVDSFPREDYRSNPYGYEQEAREVIRRNQRAEIALRLLLGSFSLFLGSRLVYHGDRYRAATPIGCILTGIGLCCFLLPVYWQESAKHDANPKESLHIGEIVPRPSRPRPQYEPPSCRRFRVMPDLKPKPKKVGRPKLAKGESKAVMLRVRISPLESKAVEATAKAQRQTVSEWIRGTLNAAL